MHIGNKPLKEVKPTIQYNPLVPKNKTIITKLKKHFPPQKIIHSLTMLIYSEYQQFQLMLSASFFLQIWCCKGNIHIFISSQYHQYFRLIILWIQLVYNKHKVKNQCYYLWQTETKVNLKGFLLFPVLILVGLKMKVINSPEIISTSGCESTV